MRRRRWAGVSRVEVTAGLGMEEFTRLQKRIEAVRDSVADSLIRLDGHCRNGQFRSDHGRPRKYKRDRPQRRNLNLNAPACMKERKMICHSSVHLFQSWRTAGSSRTGNSSEQFRSEERRVGVE